MCFLLAVSRMEVYVGKDYNRKRGLSRDLLDCRDFGYFPRLLLRVVVINVQTDYMKKKREEKTCKKKSFVLIS